MKNLSNQTIFSLLFLSFVFNISIAKASYNQKSAYTLKDIKKREEPERKKRSLVEEKLLNDEKSKKLLKEKKEILAKLRLISFKKDKEDKEDKERLNEHLKSIESELAIIKEGYADSIKVSELYASSKKKISLKKVAKILEKQQKKELKELEDLIDKMNDEDEYSSDNNTNSNKDSLAEVGGAVAGGTVVAASGGTVSLIIISAVAGASFSYLVKKCYSSYYSPKKDTVAIEDKK